ncbi:MAG: HAD-IA family hydrolase [Chlamydiota bacterium]|nr:HAD-IA family hydrolase [Chlamydiota bacterium]
MKLIIFDLDGTLIDSRHDIASSVNAALSICGLAQRSVEEITGYVGSGVVHLLQSALGEYYSDAMFRKVIKKFRAHYGEHMLDQTQLYPGVRDVLSRMGDYHKCVLTNKPLSYSMGILKGLSIDHFFLNVIGGDSKYPKKPDPAAVYFLMEHHQVSALSTMIVGDSPVDINTGSNAGIFSCAALYGFTDAPLLERSNAHYKINSFNEIGEILCNGS